MTIEEANHKYNLFYGLQEGVLKHISEVANGLKCGCLCPACKKKLVAKNGGTKKIHHFAHYKSQECKYGAQTAIHLAAKEILAKSLRIKIPILSAFIEHNLVLEKPNLVSKGKSVILMAEQEIQFDSVIIEKRLHKYIPDVIIIKNGKKLIVEIAVTHFVDDAKLKKIIDSNISAIEIDLSRINSDFNIADLEKLVIEDFSNREWLFNRKSQKLIDEKRPVIAERIQKEYDKEFERWKKDKAEKEKRYEKIRKLREIEFEEERKLAIDNRKYHKEIVRGSANFSFTPYVINCPISNKTNDKGLFFVNLKECKRCLYHKLFFDTTHIFCLYGYNRTKNVPFKLF